MTPCCGWGGGFGVRRAHGLGVGAHGAGDRQNRGALNGAEIFFSKASRKR